MKIKIDNYFCMEIELFIINDLSVHIFFLLFNSLHYSQYFSNELL